MGYRNHIYKIKLKKYASIRDKKLEELLELYGSDNCLDEKKWIGITDIIEECKFVEVINLGKWIDKELEPKNQTPFFSDKKTNECFNNSDNELMIINRNSVVKLIKQYKDITIKYLKESLKPLHLEEEDCSFDLKSIIKMVDIIQERIRWIKYIDLDKNSENITGSWLYEHEMFNLIHKYKNLKDDDVLVWAGW